MIGSRRAGGVGWVVGRLGGGEGGQLEAGDTFH